MIASRLRIVVTDANVLINLIHVGRLDVLGALEGHEFVVPADVREEITDLDQRAALDEAIGRFFFCIELVTELETVALFAEGGRYSYDDRVPLAANSPPRRQAPTKGLGCYGSAGESAGV